MTVSFALLRVRIGPQAPAADTPLDWLALDTAGRPLARGAQPAAALPAADALELVLPAGRVSAHLLEIPPAGSRHEAALIRQALEDRLLGDAVQNLVVSGLRHGKQLEVWIAARDWLEQTVRGFIAASGRTPALLTPEQALLAPGSHAETASGWIFQREPGAYGLLPSLELVQSLGGADLQAQPDLLAAPPAKRANLLAALPGLGQSGARFTPALFKPALLLLIAAALVYLLSQFLVWRQLATQEASLRQAIRQNFAAANPGVPIVDPILQWRQRQGKPGQQGGDALDQLAQLAALTQLTLQPRRIEAEEGRLKLTLTSADVAQLKSALQARNIAFETQTTDKGLEQLSLAPGKPQP